MKYLYGLFELYGRPGELSDHPRAGKSNVERCVDLERLRDVAHSAYGCLESCAPEKIYIHSLTNLLFIEAERKRKYLWNVKSSTSPPGGNLVDGLPPVCSNTPAAYSWLKMQSHFFGVFGKI